MERADGPGACRLVAACRKRRGRGRVSGRRGEKAGRGLARRRRCRVPLRALLFHCRPPAPSPRGAFPRRLGEARRPCRRAVGQGLVASGGERLARAAVADNCVVEKTPRDRRATACRSVCAREHRFARPPGDNSSPRPWWRVTVGRGFRTHPRPLRPPVACSCGGHQSGHARQWASVLQALGHIFSSLSGSRRRRRPLVVARRGSAWRSDR